MVAGETSIVLGKAYLKADSLLLQLPPISISAKESHWHRQMLEFQNTKAYFAKEEDLGGLQDLSVTLNGEVLTLCEACEIQSWQLPKGPRDSLVLRLRYKLHLPKGDFTPQGIKERYWALLDWLPRVPVLADDGWRAYSTDFFYNQYWPEDSFAISWNVPAEMRIAGNAQLVEQTEERWYQNLSSAAPTVRQGRKAVHYRHRGRHLHFFLSPEFRVWERGGLRYFSLEAPPWLPAILPATQRTIGGFFNREVNDSLNRFHTVVFLPEKKRLLQSDGLLSLQDPKDLFDLEWQLTLARAYAGLTSLKPIDAARYPWLARGLPYAYAQWYVEEQHPEKKWLPYSNSLLGKIFDLDELAYSYENHMLYLFLARQGLDQPLGSTAHELTRLNLKAIAEAKAYLALNHLRQYVGVKNFKRSLARYLAADYPQYDPLKLQQELDYYSNKNLDWFFKEGLSSADFYDYKLAQLDYCPTVATANIHNLGHRAVPYSLTGYQDGQKVLTEWHPGHLGKKSVQMYHARYERVVINEHQQQPEYRQNNNRMDRHRLLPKVEPLRLQLLNGFENPQKSEVYALPSANYNAYDRLLLGVSLYNEALVNKDWEYTLAPFYSTGTGKLTGNLALGYTQVLPKSSPVRSIKYGFFARYFHYDRDLAFSRFSPSVRFLLRKPYPRSPLIHSLRLRVVSVDRELRPNFDGVANSFNDASYTIFSMDYQRENTLILQPTILRAGVELGDQFGKLQLTLDQRWMLPNRRWLIWRGFGGLLLYNDFLKQGVRDNFYSFGLAGTRDYLFDYGFFGRSDTGTIWSQQMFSTDGGFRGASPVFADEWMLASNLSLPLWNMFGLYADVGVADDFDRLYYGYGVRIAPVSDFAEVYFPIGNQDGLLTRQRNYAVQIRFLIDLDLSNIRDRVRRGFY